MKEYGSGPSGFAFKCLWRRRLWVRQWSENNDGGDTSEQQVVQSCSSSLCVMGSCTPTRLWANRIPDRKTTTSECVCCRCGTMGSRSNTNRAPGSTKASDSLCEAVGWGAGHNVLDCGFTRILPPAQRKEDVWGGKKTFRENMYIIKRLQIYLLIFRSTC